MTFRQALIMSVAAVCIPVSAQQKRYEVRIDSACNPVGVLTRASLAVGSPSHVRKFWIEQEIAIEQSIEREFRVRQLKESEREINAKIQELERRKNEATVRELGIIDPSNRYATPPGMKEKLQGADDFLRLMDTELLQRRLLWAEKCLTQARQRIAATSR